LSSFITEAWGSLIKKYTILCAENQIILVREFAGGDYVGILSRSMLAGSSDSSVLDLCKNETPQLSLRLGEDFDRRRQLLAQWP